MIESMLLYSLISLAEPGSSQKANSFKREDPCLKQSHAPLFPPEKNIFPPGTNVVGLGFTSTALGGTIMLDELKSELASCVEVQ
jgi:hypothetical protein